MQKSKLASFLDAIIISSLVLVMVLMLSTKITKALIPRLGISCILAVVCFYYVIKKDKKKYQNQQLKNSEEKHLKNCILHLNFMNHNTRIAFLSQIFENYKKENNLESISFFYDFDSDTTNLCTLSEMISLVQNHNHDTCVLLSNNLSASAKELLNYSKNKLKTKIVVMQKEELYTLMKKQNIFPVEIDSPSPKFELKKFFSLFSGALSRPRAKHYILLAMVFFFSSYVLPFNSYYKTFAIIALLLTILSLLFGKQSSHQHP